MVTIKTSMGDIKLELLKDEAPETVENFIGYINDGHYNNTIFHRVIAGFMIQGGGFDATFTQLPTKANIKNEADNRIENKRGTVAMARTPDPHSASSQFFVNVSDNDFLNYKSSTPDGYGYCVFARVVDGMDVVDEITAVPTGTKGQHSDVPMENVMILEVVEE
jgi:peptidyl-prolyl cis-trans isomerase B (cyclophilin B)